MDEIKNSIDDIYTRILNKKKEKKEVKYTEDIKEVKEETKLDKAKRKEKNFNTWENALSDLMGEDFEYEKPKKPKNRYKKWITMEDEDTSIETKKPEKRKKRNYKKEFEPELNMLKNALTDQNKFTNDLVKRFQVAAGPSNKDGQMNKTLVDLAATINASRGNSLGLLREIGSLKKTVAELYMRQRKLDSELGGGLVESQDVALMGSSIASSMFAPSAIHTAENNVNSSAPVQKVNVSAFDPSTWSEDITIDDHTKFETVPHKVVVEWHKDKDIARFKAIDPASGEELDGCPVPTYSIKSIDKEKKLAKDDFDQIYDVEII